MADPKWIECLDPLMPEVVTFLPAMIREGVLLDKLLSKRLLTAGQYEEFFTAQSISQENLARKLVFILRKRPSPSFNLFMSVLEEVDGGKDLLSCFTKQRFNQDFAAVHSASANSLQGDCSDKKSNLEYSDQSTIKRPEIGEPKQLLKDSFAVHSASADCLQENCSDRKSKHEHTDQSTIESPEIGKQKQFLKDSAASALPLSSKEALCGKKERLPDLDNLSSATRTKQTALLERKYLHIQVDETIRDMFESYKSEFNDILQVFMKQFTVPPVILPCEVSFLKLTPARKPHESPLVPVIKIPERKCLIRLLLPFTDAEGFKEEEPSLRRKIYGLTGIQVDAIEIVAGSCYVNLTMSGKEFIRFVCGLNNPENVSYLVEFDASIKLRIGDHPWVSLSLFLLRCPSLHFHSVAKALRSCTRNSTELVVRKMRKYLPHAGVDAVYHHVESLSNRLTNLSNRLVNKPLWTPIHEKQTQRIVSDFRWIKENTDLFSFQLKQFWLPAIFNLEVAYGLLRNIRNSVRDNGMDFEINKMKLTLIFLFRFLIKKSPVLATLRSELQEFISVMDPEATAKRLFDTGHISEVEFDWLLKFAMSTEKKSRAMVTKMLWQRSFENVPNVLRTKNEQGQIALEKLSELIRNKEKMAWKKKQNEAKEVDGLLRQLAGKEEAAKSVRGNDVTENDEIGGQDWTWRRMEKRFPVRCRPYRRVAELNGIIHAAWYEKVYLLTGEEWKKKDVGFWIESFFECNGKGYLVKGGQWKEKCKAIFEWKNEKEVNLNLTKRIPVEYQLRGRSSLGSNGKIYFVGGEKMSKRVDSFDITEERWIKLKEMGEGREWCTLATIDNKLFVGGGEWMNKVECYIIKEDRWIDIKPTTNCDCEFSSWNGKLVATGGTELSSLVEMYDDVSGEWVRFPEMNEGRRSHGTCVMNDNKLVVLGGYGALNSLEYLKM
ncbi:uncharacterized protein [Oscarella lobularis]|uniref:uncharacterized protein isoform X2 n=1 Tax=Oscarella lobularis TaxID=121494 RepID=UPI003313ACD2